MLMVAAVSTREDESVFISHSAYGLGKYLTWIIFFGFLGYTIYCGSKENFFKSLRRLSPFLWARQIGIDLYIGLMLPLLIIYLHEGLLVSVFWLFAILIYANLATLLYFALNFDSLVNHIIG